ncbi:LLM class flavin-dependent oxidoreductase [Acrocarpospora macrocephala]|uniref:Monooxygenase n=1 Tax=Acrocarpospora macrocephala TaxID=150177 RepID=A0A5M3WJ83_9ACTN|nr:NtaA/DmoA family FMN-dependent monooxygenase [Acrocarpospora macrocephala]GES07083.1 monooxygenase [Acrocarpospora macrocephala]
MSARKMHLAAYVFVPSSHFVGMWQHPFTQTNFTDRALYENLARTLEQGRFDLAFMPDQLGIPGTYEDSFRSVLTRGARGVIHFDPTLVLQAMAGVTNRLGLAGTLSTTFYPPYHLARLLGSLDLLSGGRAAWNIVTTADPAAAANFGHTEMPGHDERYEIADEVLEATSALWSSWDPDAMVMDRERGVFIEPDKVHRVDYQGQYVQVRGPLTLPPSPQGRPVFMQAGASDRGRDFAARWAEVVFLIQNNPDDMRAVRADIRARAEKLGRDPDGLKFLPAVQVILGETAGVARERQRAMEAMVDPALAIGLFSELVKADLSSLPPEMNYRDALQETAYQGTAARGSAQMVLKAIDRDDLSLAEAATLYSTSHFSPQLVGSPVDVADRLQEMFESEACDGFVITPIHLPGSFEEFVRGVIPELQRRSLFRTEYEGSTLRDVLNLGPLRRA